MPSAPTHTPLTGDDIDKLLADNDGVGPFEMDRDGEAVDRWQFPRFLGATDDADMYLSRIGIGPYDTDVETLCAWFQAPRNMVGAILALSEPGTGKTALIEAAVTHLSEACKVHRKTAIDVDCKNCKTRGMMTVLCTPDHTKDALFKVFVGEDHGDLLPNGKRSPFTLGPIPYAAKHGLILYMDEVMRLDDGVMPVLYSLADGRHYLPEGNVDGSPLEIHPDFRLVLSSNPMVRGASLPEPLASRCASTTITVKTDASLLRDLGIDESVVACWETLVSAGLFHPQVRELRMADYWLSTDPTQAASAFIPEHCPESEREAVTDMVRSFIGGDLPSDGRLVVK